MTASLDLERVGGFAEPGAILRQAVGGLRRRRMLPSETAERYRRLNNVGSYVGPWRNDSAPYLVEPMDACVDRAVSTVVMVGPSQFGKTEIPLNLIAHGAKVRPTDMLVIQPTRDLALDFAARRIDEKLLRASPSLAEELGGDRSDDTVTAKRFRNGLMVSVAWPTSGQISSRPIPFVVIDERDSMKDTIGEEGDPVTLARQRTKTFGSNGTVYVSSSPKRLDGSGIVSLYAQGDRRLWFVPCPDCGGYFAPGFGDDRRPLNTAPADGAGFGGLHWSAGSDAAKAGREAALLCPHCGGRIAERHKRAMNAAGVWLAAGQSIDAAGRISGVAPATRVRSYWFCGLMNNFGSWSAMAEGYVEALATFDGRLDDRALRAVVNTEFGFPYVSPRAEDRPVSIEDLAGRAEGSAWSMRTVPDWAEFLVAAVDVQSDRFEVAVWACRADNAAGLVDRFAIRQVEEGGARVDVRPAERPEQWDTLLDEVLAARYPLAANPARALRVAALAVDTGGEDGVTANAYDFYLRAMRGSAERRAIPPARLVLVKGAAHATGPLVSRSSIERVTGGRGVATVHLHVLNVHELKSIVSRRLRREDFGPSSYAWPAGTPARVFDELLGEVKVDGAWKRQGANETFDLAVYGAALVMTMRPKAWGANRPWFCNPVEIEAPATKVAPADPGRASAVQVASAEAPVAAVPSRRRRRQSWGVR